MTTKATQYQFLARPATAPRGNVTAQVTDALREAIVSLALKPGEVLDKGAVCEQLQVSRFPVSEALARLQAEGLVEIQPQRGTTVSLVRIADVVEYMLIRRALETETVRVLVGQHGPHLIDTLKRNIAYQRAAVELDDQLTFHARDLEFHDILFAALNFAKFKGVIESSRANLDRARRLIITPRRLVISMTEHQQILAAIEAGDAEAATRAMRGHINSVMIELVAFAREHRHLFADGERLTGQDSDFFPFG